MTYTHVENASSGRSKCKNCHVKIEYDSKRLVYRNDFGGKRYLCQKCGIEQLKREIKDDEEMMEQLRR